MEYRTLGKTGLQVSALGLGGASLGGVYGPVDEAAAIRAVHTAFDLGVNYVDTSPYYGLTRAEEMLGKALKEIARDRYFLATKVGRYGVDDFDFSAARTRASVEESLRRLGVDYVDVIQAHDIEFGSLDQVVEETLPALREIQRQGKARFIGITGFPLKVFRTVLDRTGADTILTYCHYTLWDTSAAQLLPYLEAKRMGAINASALGMGLLSNHGPQPWHPASEVIKTTCARAVAHARARGADAATLAVQFAVAEARFHTTLVGTASAEEIERNVQAIESPLDAGLLEDVQAILAPIRNQSWPVGRPENS
jgi:L-galactose dehydrogenase